MERTRTTPRLDARSVHLRREIIHTVERARRGHLNSAFSVVEVLRLLYDEVLRVDPANPLWPDRDRLVLSKGHGCLALYVLLAEKGFFPREHLQTFCAHGSILGGQPQLGKVPGVEASTGSLGHGLPIGVGFALAGRLDGRDFRTYVVLGDGECDEGSVWEAAMCAGKHRLARLTVLVDYNKMQSYGPTAEVQDLEPFAAKWRSFGFAAREVDGHDLRALRRALAAAARETDKPTAIICHTIKGRGIRMLEGNLDWHHKSKISDADLARIVAELEGVEGEQ